MYFKMAVNNVKKSFKDYAVYFLTLTFAVCIFYSFNSINSQTMVVEMNSLQRDYIDLMNQFMSILSVGVSVILGSLIIYATNFLIKRRNKEFGVYMTLGMRKRSMSIILFFETLFIGLISLGIGLILGLILSQVLSVFTAKLFDVEMTKYVFSISIEAIVKTVVYFGVMYVIVMIFNIIVISKYKLIDLLYVNKKSEKIKIKNPYISSIFLLLSLMLIGIAYKCITISELDFYTIQFKIAIAFGIIGTILFFYSASSLMILILQKNDNLYLNGLNAFTIKQISSKFNTNFLSMSVICLMLLVTIGSLASGLSVKNSMEQGLEKNTPVDVSILWESNDSKNNFKYIDLLKESVKKYDLDLSKMRYSILSAYSINFDLKSLLYNYAESDDKREMLDYPIASQADFITISDYNNFRKLRDLDPIALNEDEVIISSNYAAMIDMVKSYLDKNKKIKIENKEYKIKNDKLLEESFFNMPIAINVFSIIVPDNTVSENNKIAEALNFNIVGDSKEEELEGIMDKLLLDRNNNSKKEDFYIDGYTREMCYTENKGLSAILLFIAIYIGIVFLLASAAVLSLQQLCECNDSLERYISLNKIGASKKIINKSIFKQVLTFFLFPLALALVHSYVGIKTVNSYLLALGESNKIYPMLITALILVIVYGGYLYATYISYKNVINNELS
ncbi:FtsX-like permease family protein [uncultured Clostridium sp.]|uniref:FtsX-like permease family protein n=1 Tax=uncultured Clostridium sp. TaxID=59620 RepID=UPI00258D0C94|nr:FtsX-like permease family protein [uncultured Clostridium sp.]